jgi:hypothetical protein
MPLKICRPPERVIGTDIFTDNRNSFVIETGDPLMSDSPDDDHFLKTAIVPG